MWYRIDYKRLVELLLPTFLRKKIILAFLRAIIIPVTDIYTKFTIYRFAVSKRIDFNGQVMYLEKMLNDEFDLTDEIYITDAVKIPVLYLHYKAELQIPVYLSGKRTILIHKSEIDSSDDFIVNIPIFLNTVDNITRIKRITDYYKYAGKCYKINIYEQTTNK